MPTPARTAEQTKTRIALWTGVFAGPIAWAIDEVIGYTATPHACSTGHMYLLHALTVAMLVLCAVGFLAAWESRMSPDDAGVSIPNDASEQRRMFMANGGMFLSIGFAIVISTRSENRFLPFTCFNTNC